MAVTGPRARHCFAVGAPNDVFWCTTFSFGTLSREFNDRWKWSRVGERKALLNRQEGHVPSAESV